jgi:hypothetical protein
VFSGSEFVLACCASGGRTRQALIFLDDRSSAHRLLSALDATT